jgi:hypothetical protein
MKITGEPPTSEPIPSQHPITDDDAFNAALGSRPADDHFEASVTAGLRALTQNRRQRREAFNTVLDRYGIRRMWMAVKILLGVTIVCDAVAVVGWVLYLCGAR